MHHCCFKTIVKGYTKISSKAKNVTLKAAPSNVRSATFDIFLDNEIDFDSILFDLALW
jgi:hypothetical protein